MSEESVGGWERKQEKIARRSVRIDWMSAAADRDREERASEERAAAERASEDDGVESVE